MSIAAACVSAVAAHAALPLVTDDARLLDSKTCQLETYYRHDRNGHEWGALPTCNPFGTFEMQLGTTRTRAEGLTSERLIVQLKTVLRPSEPDDWGIGVVAGAQDALRPGASRRFGETYVNVPVTFSFRDDQVLLHVNGGIDRNRYEGGTRLTWGVATEVLATSRITLLAETFGTDEGKPFWQAGAWFMLVPDRVQLHAAHGGQWRGAGDARWWSIGLRFVTPTLW